MISPKTDEKEKALIKKAGRFKGSLVFLEALEQYVLELTEKTVPDKDFVLWGHVLYTTQQVQREIFLKSDAGWAERLESLRNRLKINVKKMRDKIEEDKNLLSLTATMIDRFRKGLE